MADSELAARTPPGRGVSSTVGSGRDGILSGWRGARARSAGRRPLLQTVRTDSPFIGLHEELFHRSEEMRAVERLVHKAADADATILIQGETGVGKGLVAKALHDLSSRATKPWVKVNCASLSSELLESELFGHEKGAFTGAADRKPGRFELASGGTLFLDEIGDLALSLQPKLLHVLQDNEFFRLGGRELIKVDVRVVAATNKDVQTMLANGLFREDLYHRLNVINVRIPPLRKRKEEILSLVEFFYETFAHQFYRQPAPLSRATLDLLLAYSWPGNVRELENLIKRYVVLEDEGMLREEIELRLQLEQPQAIVATVAGEAVDGAAGLREIGRKAAQKAERAAITEILDRVHWNRAEAARQLRISYKALLYKIREMNLGGKAP